MVTGMVPSKPSTLDVQVGLTSLQFGPHQHAY
jgi:hypothetical protein